MGYAAIRYIQGPSIPQWVTPQFLRSKRKHAIVILFVLAAVFTPPDVYTQVAMALPLLVLYEVSVLLSRVAHARRQRRAGARDIP